MSATVNCTSASSPIRASLRSRAWTRANSRARRSPSPSTAIVADLSFISLTKALGPALALAAPGAWLVALIKPQFEAGREHVGKGGIVRDAAARQLAVDLVTAWLAGEANWSFAGVVPSPILGGSGNEEFLLGAHKDG